MPQTIDDITEILKNEDAAPPDLGEIYTQLSGWYSYYGQMLKRIHVMKPEAWIALKRSGSPKPYSDAMTDMLWLSTEEGKQETALLWEEKRIKEMMKAVNSRLYIDNNAAKSMY